jgi:2-oxoglutarate dehydrogenase E2 component (dihydrolipoamide succinyltransferase)
MSIEIKVPTVGESITEVTVATWLKNDGDHVEIDEIIAELESDKATFELPAEGAGILRIVAQEGDTIEIGATLCTIDTAGAASTAAASTAPAATPVSDGAAKATGEVRDMIVPTVGESITEVTISGWLKEDGDYVALDEIIAEVDSDKATFELPAEGNGILRIVAQEDDVLEIGALICKIEIMEGGAPVAAGTTPAAATASSAPTSENTTYATGHASPAAAKILAEKGIDAASVKGTGKDGRITKEDAEAAKKTAPAPKAASKPAASAPAAPEYSGGVSREERREKMTSLRKTVAKRLVSVKNETAMLTTFNEVDMKPIMDLRKQYKEQFKEKHGVGLGFMSFFAKACCVALQEWPAVNAKIDGNDMIFND